MFPASCWRCAISAASFKIASPTRSLVFISCAAATFFRSGITSRSKNSCAIDISMSVPDGERLGNRASPAKNPIFAGDARFPNRSPSGTDIEMSIAQEFFDLLVIPLRKKVAAAQLMKTKLRVGDAILKLAAEMAQRQHEAGNINDLDLANQQATYSQSKLDIAETSASIRAGREKLNRLMGTWGDDTAWKIDDKLSELS